eukprot:243513-Heterocapsa_arctica.AAC.1
MCAPGVGWLLALLVTSLQVVDALMYKVFGDGSGLRARASLLTMLGLGSAAFARTQESLPQLLSPWNSTAPAWAIFKA